MAINLTLTGDINLMGVTDPKAPFAKIGPRLRESDLVFANLECCFYQPTEERSANAEGFYADPSTVTAMADARVAIVGNANNVNYGAGAIRASLDCLDAAGIEHVGAGRSAAEAHAAVALIVSLAAAVARAEGAPDVSQFDTANLAECYQRELESLAAQPG